MYIDKIITLLQKYINEYDAKKYELEELNIKKQLYEELISLLENKLNLNDNKLFISILLTSIFNNEEYNIKFYNALYLFNQNDEKHFDYFGTKIKHQYENICKKIATLKKQLKNASNRKNNVRRASFYLQKRKPIYDKNSTFKDIKKIISYYAIMGEISDKEEVLLNNELEFYNTNIIKKENKEKEYKTRKYNEIPNILNCGFEMYDEIDVNPNRLEATNNYVNELKTFINDLKPEEIIPIIETYQKYDLNTNEYIYIVNELLKYFLMESLEYYKILLDISVYQDKETREEAIETYYTFLDKYILLRNYYNTLTEIEINDIQYEIEEPDNKEQEDNKTPRKLIFSHPSTNPNKSRLIDDLKGMPEEYYSFFENMLQNFIVYKKRPKGFNNDIYKKGFIELKEGPIRILMKHTNNNIYCVMGVFIKKANNDIKAYRTMVIRTIPNIKTHEEENQELTLGKLTLQELSRIVEEKARKGSR